MPKLPMYLLKLSILILLISSCTNSHLALDITKTNLAGVELGMTRDQAESALKKFYQHENLEIHVNELRRDGCPRLDAEIYNEASNENSNQFITQSITIFFLPPSAKDQSKCIAYDINYRFHDAKNASKNLLEVATKKYGSPTSSNQGQALWCQADIKEACANQPSIVLYSIAEESGIVTLLDPYPWHERKKFEQRDIINELEDFEPDF